jgi:hypothetical protein
VCVCVCVCVCIGFSGEINASPELSPGTTPGAYCRGGWVFPRAGPDLLDKENLLLSGHEPRMFHVVTLVTIL